MMKVLRVRDRITNEFINKEMEFEEVLQMLNNIMVKKSNELYAKLVSIQQNILDREDIMSLYMIDILSLYINLNNSSTLHLILISSFSK